MPVGHVANFGGGVVKAGSSDSRSTSELEVCDALVIGDRGQLIPASDVTDFLSWQDALAAAPSKLLGLTAVQFADASQYVSIFQGNIGGPTPAYLLGYTNAGWGLGFTHATAIVAPAPRAEGVLATFASFSYTAGTTASRWLLINIGARSAQNPNLAPGLYIYDLTAGTFLPINDLAYQALGTGAGATKPLYFRGIGAYNGHAFGWGFDNSASANGYEGPARLMFSNPGKPHVWGEDPGGGAPRTFIDTDAILIGAAGEMIKGCVSYKGRYWIGTNRELHWIAGYGRESFLTDGATASQRALDVVGPNAMLEGPDGLLYGVGVEGLWHFDGDQAERVGRKLRDYQGRSNGYWDLIWQDAGRATTYPGQSNADLVWMYSDPERMEVCVVIPWCNAANGYGYGVDTAVIRYQTQTGGFSRQFFAGEQYTAGTTLGQATNAPRAIAFATATAGQVTLKHYGYRATPTSLAPLPADGGITARTNEFALFGPEGAGVYRKLYLTLSWDSAASLPLQLQVRPTVDGQDCTDCYITVSSVAPVAPNTGDRWLDTSGTDAVLGVGLAGSSVTADADYRLKEYRSGAWMLVPGAGQKGLRATIPLAFKPKRGTRMKVQLWQVAAAGRYMIEGLAPVTTPIREAA